MMRFSHAEGLAISDKLSRDHEMSSYKCNNETENSANKFCDTTSYLFSYNPFNSLFGLYIKGVGDCPVTACFG